MVVVHENNEPANTNFTDQNQRIPKDEQQDRQDRGATPPGARHGPYSCTKAQRLHPVKPPLIGCDHGNGTGIR
jgi:hypothetical protein